MLSAPLLVTEYRTSPRLGWALYAPQVGNLADQASSFAGPSGTWDHYGDKQQLGEDATRRARERASERTSGDVSSSCTT